MSEAAGQAPPAAAGPARIEVCVDGDALALLGVHPGIDMFRASTKQHQALVGIARDPQTCVSVAVDGGLMVAYAAFHPPSDVESWGEDRTGRIIELGAVEVAPPYRGQRLAERLLAASFEDGRFEGTVVFATMYVWHYDLKRTGLNDFAYKRLLERLYRSAGFVPFPTADAEVRSSAANQLMARIGAHADPAVVEEFHRLRTRPRFYG
ncbi:MAG TPA: GNAT family N-acetyltransferase [Trueperaceae bacterium]|nr:GNAT family N-acetyltransferase [Trueperaceae bacterium]